MKSAVRVVAQQTDRESWKTMFHLKVVVAVGSCLTMCSAADHETSRRGFTVAKAGKPMALLVLADKPENPQVIKYAADEFQRVIQKATGVKIAAIPERQLNRQLHQDLALIFLGPC